MKKRVNYFNVGLFVSASILFLVIGLYRYSKKVIPIEDLYEISDNKKENNISKKETNLSNLNSIKEESENQNTIFVEIKGEVIKPGVYELKNGDRVIDLVNIAGGLTQNAINNINMAKKLVDEDSINILSKEDILNKVSQENIENSNDELNENFNKENEKNKKIDLNTASIEELKTVPGIGDVTAKNIVEYREINGKFKNIESLMEINRIGQKTFDKMKDYFFVN